MINLKQYLPLSRYRDFVKKVNFNIQIFWNAALCKLVNSCRRFGAAYCVQLQGKTVQVPLASAAWPANGSPWSCGNFSDSNVKRVI